MGMKMLKSLSLLCLLLALCSCQAVKSLNSTYGSFVQDAAAEKEFLGAVPRADYAYYTFGSHSFPDVLLGLDRKLTPAPGVFTAVDLSPESMKALVGNMEHKAVSQADILRGFKVLDQNGNLIGVWYSPFLFNSNVRVKDGIAYIAAPDFPNRPFGKPSPETEF